MFEDPSEFYVYQRALEAEIRANPLELGKLQEEVEIAEGMLAGGSAHQLGPVSALVKSLRESKLLLGDPRPFLTHVKSDGDWSYYGVNVPLTLQPARGAIFTLLEISLQFGSEAQAVVHSMFPNPKWRNLFAVEYDIEAAAGIDGDLEWQVEAPPAVASELTKRVASASAKVRARGQGGLRIVMPKLGFRIGRAEISATGVGGPYCFWRFEAKAIPPCDNLSAAVVLRVPRGTASLDLTCVAAAVPSFGWFSAPLDQVMVELSARLRAWVGKRKRAPVIGVSEHWMGLQLGTASNR